jgi:chromosomal replication initiator protein
VDDESGVVGTADPITVENTLNPKYTFSSFVVGNNNNLAYVASLAVAERPAKTYNPLFLYGGSGLGKTHLMQAIGNFYRENYPKKKVLYTTSEKFTYELVTAIREKTNQAFRNKYRKVDLLLIDDVQFFANKELAQEEFFHTFNALFEKDKQIVLTCDRLPSEIPQLEERLKTRFNSGLLADVQPPDYETRMAILKNKIQSEYLSVDEEIVEFIADSIKSNVRDLEGAVKRILVYAGIKRTNEISMELATAALRDILAQQPQRVITAKLIIDEVERYFRLSKGSIISKKRSKDVALPRQVGMYICRELLDDPSFPRIGEEFGGRDHTTALHNVKKISTDILTDKELENTVKEIISNIKKG